MMMLSTMTASPPPGKARAYSDGDSILEFDFEDSLQRAQSSEAQLPSYGNTYDDVPYGGLHGSLSISTTGSNDSFVGCVGSPPPRRHDASNTHLSPKSPRAGFARSNSDGANRGSARRLQTIESGIALADQEQQGPSSPAKQGSTAQPRQLSPRRQSYQDSNSPGGGGFSPALPPRRPSNNSYSSLPPMIPQMDSSDGPKNLDRPELQRVRVPSDLSYYSVDAGKHGFLTHYQGRGPGPGGHGNNDNDSDVGSVDASSASDSLVFKYQPGQETPPAEYSLPASILKVYGFECDEGATPAAVAPMENGKRIRWHRAYSDEGSGTNYYSYSSQSTIVFDVERGLSDASNISEGRNDANTEKQASPPGNPSSLRVPHLMALPSADDLPPKRILPYHERKRLMELEEEERRRKKKGAKNVRNQQQSKSAGKGAKGSPKEDEATPLTGQHRGYGTDDVASNNDNDKTQKNHGWFGQLLSVVTGQSSDGIDQQRRHDRSVSQDESAQSYRDRGRAFLQKTEKQRMMLKEQNRMEELNNVTIPVTNQSFSHSRAKMSSMSNALDSIVDCSDDDDDESSDEESGSSYYFDDDGAPRDAAPGAAARVWRYGEPPTASADPGRPNKAGTMARKKRSRRDRVMTRERLLQEEYEYRLHSLRKENETLSKRFRLFVLVTVAVVFVGALAFALVVCVRMLMSI